MSNLAGKSFFSPKNLVVPGKSRIFAPNKLMCMTKKILKFAFVGLLVTAMPAAASASEMAFAATEQVEDAVSVTGAQGQTLEVVSLTGRLVMSVKIDSPAQRVELNVPKGCYILKVGKVVRKIQVR